MSKITCLYNLLTWIQSWSEYGANFAVSMEDICAYFDIDYDAQRLKIAEDMSLLDGIYRTSIAYGDLPALALTQFCTWLLHLQPDEIESGMRPDFDVFKREFLIAIKEDRINPLNGQPQDVGL